MTGSGQMSELARSTLRMCAREQGSSTHKGARGARAESARSDGWGWCVNACIARIMGLEFVIGVVAVFGIGIGDGVGVVGSS